MKITKSTQNIFIINTDKMNCWGENEQSEMFLIGITKYNY